MLVDPFAPLPSTFETDPFAPASVSPSSAGSAPAPYSPAPFPEASFPQAPFSPASFPQGQTETDDPFGPVGHHTLEPQFVLPAAAAPVLQSTVPATSLATPLQPTDATDNPAISASPPVVSAELRSPSADVDANGNWIPPLLRGMAPKAERELETLPRRTPRVVDDDSVPAALRGVST